MANLVIYATPQGRTVRLEEKRLQSAEAPSPQPVNLPFQKGAPINPPGRKEDQEVEDLCHEVLMVRISELHESEDDSMDRLNLDDYNSDNYDEYLSDNMETTPPVVTEVETTIKQDPPAAPPAVTVTVQLEEQPATEDLYERHRLLN